MQTINQAAREMLTRVCGALPVIEVLVIGLVARFDLVQALPRVRSSVCA
jgi:hypothetical protein